MKLLLVAAKSPFFVSLKTTKYHWIKLEPRWDEAPRSPLSAKVSFARIGPAVLKLTSDNHKKPLDNYYM